MNAIFTLLRRLRESRKAYKQAKRQQQAACYYTNAVQATEWQNRMYITYKGLPIIAADDLKVGMPEAIRMIRGTLAAFTLEDENS